ncbi:MAG: hypothetical protein GY762_07780, partial [Proteobacteria bacterium]|nr:hypothetical protein [Pseudomonadota bacterium]
MIPRLYQFCFFLSLSILCAVVPENLWAADADVDVSASANPTSLREGEKTVLAITIEVPTDYHIYSMTKIPMGPLPLTIAIEQNRLKPIDDWYAAKPIVAFDGNFKKAVEYHDNKVIYSRPFALIGKNPGPIQVRAVVRGQICNQNQCIAFKKQLSIPLTGEAGTARAQFIAVPTLSGEGFPLDRPAPTIEEIKDFEGNLPGLGLVGFLIIAFIAGLGALVTPCVFPMIPITVSVFTKYEKTSMRRSYTMAAIYAVSIIITFTLIGMFVSAVFGAVGMQTLSSSPGFNLFLTALLIFFAFNLLGFYEINLPSRLVSRSSNKEQQLKSAGGSLAKQAGGIFFMALTFTMVSFTCTVGFIGIVLAEAAKGNWFYPAIGMFFFSLAFSLPFFFLAVFPAFANKLQGKSGQWMVEVKAILGFLELAAAFKFLSNVDLVWQWGLITKPAVLACWTLIFFAAGLHFLSILPLLRKDKNVRPLSPVRALIAIAMFAFSVYAFTGIRDNRDMGGWLDSWLPPTIYPRGDGTGGKENQAWIVDDIEKGMARARKKNLP